MDCKFLLCVSFFCIALVQCASASGDLRKKYLNNVAHQDSASDTPGTTKEEKPTGLFSRRHSQSPQRHHVSRPRLETGNVSPGSTRRQCARMMEPCSVHVPCCNPCALCHCRLFNTICQCWKIGKCPKKN